MEKQASGALEEFAFSHGEAFIGGGNRPIYLSDPEVVWYVVKGAVDVFVAQRFGDEAASDYKQHLRAGAGRLIFGVDVGEEGASSVYIAKGLPDTELRRIPRAALTSPGIFDLLAGQVDAWVSDFAATIAREVMPRPRAERFLTPDEEAGLASEGVLGTRQGVVWVSSQDGNAAFLDTGEPIGDGPGWIPLTVHSWIRLFGPSRLAVTTTRALRSEGLLFPALSEFHRLALSADEINRRLMLVDMANLQRTQAQHRRQSEERARDGLFGVLDTRRSAVQDDGPALLTALEHVGRHERIQFRAPPNRRTAEGGRPPSLAEIQRVSGVRARQVTLAGEDRWWLGDSGALLAFRRESGDGDRGAPRRAPVALIPGVSGRYRLFDPETGRSERVDERLAGDLEPAAHFFYRPLPREGAAGAGPLLRFAFHGLGLDLARFAVAGLLVGFLMLVPPILLGTLVDRVIPSGSGWQLVELAVSLLLLAALAALLQIFQGTSLMRLEATAAARIGAGLWDRMLGLPQRFFRRFSSGGLAMRAMAFQELRDQVSGIVGNALLSVIFLLPTFILLFLYDTGIGWLGLGLGLTSIGVTLAMGILQLPHQRRLLAITRRLAGMLVQLLNGIGKLRSTGSEGIGFALWAKDYREQKETEMRLGMLNEHLLSFLVAAPLLATAALFAVATWGGAALPVGDFVAVYAALMVFYMAIAQLGASFSAIAAIVPAYEQVTPILEAAPETGAEGEPPPELSGDVRLDHVSFRYSEDGPLVLRDVSIHARAGEFVAIVGESGAGKSTLFRLALGLETPLSGAVYYDGRDLGRLSKRAVRNSIGMVVQDASMMPGTVFDNIIGLARDLNEEDAWRAARLAAVDEDIAAMPMQMHTVVGDNLALFSGGQVQRIMLAGALARDPSVLFLDEATNWLDNKSQAKVMESVSGIGITRFVSAHRLSTIREADSIYVMQDGQVVQAGTYEDLVEVEGPFRNLVRRQMA